MFTGIISEIGLLQSIDQKGDWVFYIRAPQTVKDLAIGASVACSGVCLTVTHIVGDCFSVQASRETLDKTTLSAWCEGTTINLERALRMGDELGGHIVSGHVDGVATILSCTAEGDSLRVQIELPAAFAKFVAPKGSIALDGISLTVNEVDGAVFGVNLIPHTRSVTTASAWESGARVNFEIDMLARYVARIQDCL